MAKKKSLKAKLAKKAKSAVDSPSRTNSPAEPEPSTSKGSTEQTSKVGLVFKSANQIFSILELCTISIYVCLMIYL